MQLKIKPSMIIQEMQKDETFVQKNNITINPQNLVRRHMRRKHTITDNDYEDDILGMFFYLRIMRLL